MMKIFHKIKQWLLYIFFPNTCFCCGRDLPHDNQSPLCRDCTIKLEPVCGLICQRCGLPLKSGGAHCFNCRGSKAAKYKCSYIRSALCFNEPSRALIHAFKYEKYIRIAKFFAPLMYKTFKENPPFFEAEALIPVPIHKSRLKQRGFNQAEILAKHLAVYCTLPCEDILIRKRKTESQTKLNRKQRQQNITDAFEIKKGAKIKGRAFILIDDVCTTGATLEECAKVLKAAGAREVLALTALRE